MSFAKVQIGELVRQGVLLVADGHRMRNDELGKEGIPFVRGGDIGNDGSVNTTTEDHIRLEFIDRIRGKLSQPGDTVFITKGTVGRAGYLRPGQPSVVFSPQVALWRVLDPAQLCARFIYFLISSQEFQNALDAVKTHGAMAADYVSISLQHEFRFRLPDVRIQYAIASILGALDDKIELNRRMNETLERIAQAIFRDWFVDFGPTRRKLALSGANGAGPKRAGASSGANGASPKRADPVEIMGGLVQDPARAAKLAALFPVTLGDNGLPEGWEERPLSNLTSKIGSGATPRGGSQVYVDDGVALIRSQNVYDHLFSWDGLARITDEHAQQLAGVTVQRSDILINITGDSILRCCVVEAAVLPARVNQHVSIVRANRGIPHQYLHQFMVQPSTKDTPNNNCYDFSDGLGLMV